MLIPTIDERFRADPAYRRTLAALRAPAARPRVAATNLAGSSRAALAAALAEDLDAPVLVVAATAERAEAWLGDLEALVGSERVGFYPQWEILPFEDRAPQREVEGTRLEFLVGLLEGSLRVGVTTARAAIQKVVPPATLEARLLRIATGDRVDLDALLERLFEMGFEREAMVAEVGTFSLRGGILDVFGYRTENPVRIELVGDAVESIRAFDLTTQRSVAPLERVEILPARERPELARQAGERAFDRDRRAVTAAGELAPLARHLHPDTLVVVDEPERVTEAARAAWDEAARRRAEAAGHRVVPETADLYLDPAALERELSGFPRLETYGLHLADAGAVRFSTREPTPIRRSIRRLVETLRHDLAAGLAPVLLCDNYGQMERLEELLPRDVAESVALAVGALGEGFVAPEAGLAVYTDHEIFARRRSVRRRRRYPAGTRLDHLTQIEPGDWLVHLDYGVGKYRGLERLALSGEGEVEVLAIEYAEGEVLYLPVEQLERVEKFVSEEGKAPTVHRIGGVRWERQKAKTKAAIAELAEELLELHASREVAPGHPFAPDTEWQREMEAAFLYEDTPDQRAAAEATKRDMERARPMDRLICGDVGYGKTEVAIRAAFKAVQDGKQVAVIVPTTVLASQHQETFQERLADFPVRIATLSRFNSPAEERAALEGVANGTVDIVIGTHRLLSPDVAFADLGLVVIDEEQRFGVKHKERLRALKTSVDVLTLSATPIPRTLQMGLMGIREMSLIETPPRDRTPIVTWVAELDEGLVEEAIRREVDRGGQVFFVHNRVQSIDAVRRMVERLVPELRVAVAHGQMKERDLEDVMLRFFHGEVDVLVCTAIVESGLDVPTANTILIDRADRFGLAELYQLRGRVGRSHHRAYCYLLTPARAEMTEEAEKRLRTVEEHTELGAGYRIALRDLEMRGAGNLLGADQSGFIAAVGFETYLRLLEETVRELTGAPERRAAPPEMTYDADAYLPDAYVPDAQQKLALYRRLARLHEPAGIEDFGAELADRYGPLPEPAAHLLEAARLKALGAAAGLARLRVRPKEAAAELRWRNDAEPRLKAIHATADAGGVEVEVRAARPVHLRLTAADLPALSAALDRILTAVGEAADAPAAVAPARG
ncbi:MAG TPA: transcription-repair coupling factor [Gemmatimonadota bacterium]|nr:transcription-repair coupling factor [Gemmatimonadota bacterium]